MRRPGWHTASGCGVLGASGCPHLPALQLSGYLSVPRGKGLGTLRPSHAAKPKSHALLQGQGSNLELLPTQGSNPGLPQGRQVLYPLSQKGSLTKAHISGFFRWSCLQTREEQGMGPKSWL